MNSLLLVAAILSGPHARAPTRVAVIVVEPGQFESQVLISEWEREWRLSKVRAECEGLFVVRIVDRSRTAGILKVPCVVVGERQYPIRCSASGESLLSVRRILREWLVEEKQDREITIHTAILPAEDF